MIGYRALQRLLTFGGTMRRANVEDGSAIIKAVLRITDAELAGYADEALRERLTASVLQVGLCPSDMEIDGERFSALADVRCQGSSDVLSVSFDGTLREGDATVERACLNGSQRMQRAGLNEAVRR